MAITYTAAIAQSENWWIGWVEEVPGVNSQGRSRDELMENLRDALAEALEMNRAEARAAAGEAYEEVSLVP
ncbi:MAG: type II toxin-antitoxin system HicB family antitoxin [Pirellulales bacterium]